jgi:hypothetical protein
MASRVCMRSSASERSSDRGLSQNFSEGEQRPSRCDGLYCTEYSRDSERVRLHSGDNCSLLNALLLSDASVSARRVPPSERALGRTW